MLIIIYQSAACLSVNFAAKNWRKWEVVLEPENIVDKYAVCVKKNDTIVGHLPKGPISRFANTIFFSLRADEFSSRTAVS